MAVHSIGFVGRRVVVRTEVVHTGIAAVRTGVVVHTEIVVHMAAVVVHIEAVAHTDSAVRSSAVAAAVGSGPARGTGIEIVPDTARMGVLAAVEAPVCCSLIVSEDRGTMFHMLVDFERAHIVENLRSHKEREWEDSLAAEGSGRG